MKISFGTRIASLEAINKHNGYGYATDRMLDSLQRLGYQVQPNDASADVEIWFDQPHHWKFSKGPYRIGYHPWESTQLLPGWSEIMNQCDEIWTPSPIIADWYTRYAGVRVPVHVYEHGIDHVWAPVQRKPKDTIRFLHIGAEATRKGGWDTVRLFRRAFPNRTGVELTIKMINSSWNGVPRVGRVEYINKKMSFEELQDLYYDHDVFVYPSYGEGFGLTPFQAIGTGMPTITLPGWAPYARYIDPKLAISHKMVTSPWPQLHPGKIMRPSADDVIDRMRYAVDNYSEISETAFETAHELHDAYDWDTITARVFNDLKTRLK